MTVTKPALHDFPYLHIWDVQTQIQADAAGKPTGVFRYRWRCSCGDEGTWHNGGKRSGQHAKAARSARTGGERHVSAMERGETSNERPTTAGKGRP
jgi:hypothetical protein